MDLRRLRYFLAVAEHEHFTRAAEALFVSQPALSQQVRALERELGLPLFDRLGRRVELTAAGEVLREYSRRILREVDNAKAAIDDVRGAVRGTLSVASVQTANVSYLVDVVVRFRMRHPGVVVRVLEARADGVVGAVLAAEVDLGVTYLPAIHAGELETRALYDEDLVLVVPCGHPLAGRELATADAAALPLILPPADYCLRRGVEAAMGGVGAAPRVVAEITAIEGICEAVRAGLGVTVLPIRYIERRAERAGLAAVRLVDPVPRRTIGLIRRRDRHACTATRAFMRALESAARAEGAAAGVV